MKDFASAMQHIKELTEQLSYAESPAWDRIYSELQNEMGQWAEEIVEMKKAAENLRGAVEGLSDRLWNLGLYRHANDVKRARIQYDHLMGDDK